MEPVRNVETITEKRSLRGFFKNIGPGVIVVLTWLGAGDLVDSSIAGTNYGYDLMWVLALSLLLRFVIVNIMARYELCNSERITILEGFKKLHTFFPYFIAIYALIMAHLFNSYMIKGSGQVLYNLFKFGNPFLWSVVVVVSGIILLGKSVYHTIENFMKILLAIMTASFIGIAIWSTPNVGEIVQGTIGFGIPKDVGIWGAFLIAVSLTGAVAGSVANFLYPPFMKDKGWIGPEHKRLQRNDLLFAIVMAIILDLAVWIVGAEILRPNGVEIKDINDLAQTLSIQFGQFGYVLFYLGVLGALYSSVIGYAKGFPKVIVGGLQAVKTERKEKYGDVPENDPISKWLSLFIIISPIIWSLPGAPGFVSLVVFVNTLSVVGLPVISIGLLILSNQKKVLGKYTNNLFENILLIGATVLALYSSVKLAIDIFLK